MNDMNDMSSTILPKSDQLNADDLIGGPITIKITGVEIVGGEQPVIVHYEGEGGKPYKPGLSMRRALTLIWGKYKDVYTGRYLTLFREPKIKFGGFETGGIRISHMSHIEDKTTIALAETRKARKPFTVWPLVVEQPVENLPLAPAHDAQEGPMLPDKVQVGYDKMVSQLAAIHTYQELEEFVDSVVKQLAYLKAKRPLLHAAWALALDRQKAYLDSEDPNQRQPGDDEDVPE